MIVQVGQASELRVEGVRKRIGNFEIAADFRLASGERAALIGRSGIGKTTLLRILAGLETLVPSRGDAGRIFLGGDEITSWSPKDRRIGYVFQDAALFPSLDVLGNVIFGLMQRGEVSRREAEALGLDWLDKVGMKDLAHSPVGRLSGGESQRVAFIRALIWKPRLILLDEPFSALDSEMRESLRTELLKLHSLWTVPLLLVSHDERDLEAVANVRLELRSQSATSVRTVVRV